MQVKAKIVKVFPQSKTLKAIASLTIEDSFVVHGIKIIDSENGAFISMPSEKRGEKYKDICHPINSTTRWLITGAVLEAYADVVPSLQV